ncbi:MAG TPA: type II toxin-antitoxin system VapC family toxin [Chthonomonadaceae bacterium]|nr:type II toxin-antitoxin system VapC family toxin [Chthonomonadaceae bacterium]
MNLLLDTHTFLWFVWNDPQLSDMAKNLIADADNDVFPSMASAWELVIKVSIGKLILAHPVDLFLPDQLQRNNIQLLPIALPHTLRVAVLPFHHKDPFDRMLIAQSLVETMPLVSADAVLDAYGVRRLW